MTAISATSIVWILGIIQITGLVSAWLARFTEGSKNQAAAQCLFVVCLGLIGLTTMVSIMLGPRYWLASGATLSIMVLGAIWDFETRTQIDTL